MIVLGISNHGPEQLFSYLNRKYDICISSFTQVPLGGNLSLTSRVEDNIVFYTTNDFRKHIRYLQKSKFKNKRVFVFGACQQLHTIYGVIPMDYKLVESKRSLDFKLSKKLQPLPNSGEKPSKNDYDYIDLLSEKVQNGSILNTLMTVIYTIPKTVNQKAVTFGICDWFYNDLPKEKVIKFLDSAQKLYGVSKNSRARLDAVLFGSNAKNFRTAFAKLKATRAKGIEGNESLIGVECDVPAFELRYISVKFKNEQLYANNEKRSVDSLVDGLEKK